LKSAENVGDIAKTRKLPNGSKPKTLEAMKFLENSEKTEKNIQR
jgi:hypothetical protein